MAHNLLIRGIGRDSQIDRYGLSGKPWVVVLLCLLPPLL